MPNAICVTCGVQHAETDGYPARCAICEDDRQYINVGGQQWTTLDQLRRGHRNAFKEEEPRLTGIVTEPKFAIGQRALLVQTPEGNILWDCISFIDDATVRMVNALGGLKAIAISHPHFYSSMVEWSRAFGDAPIYLHEANRPWVMRPDPAIHFWSEETLPLGGGVTLIRCGGHFPGSTALHWAAGANGRGALLTADTIMVVSDRKRVSFMYSFPNMIPLPAHEVQRVVQAVAPFEYDRIYSGWFDSTLASGAKAAVEQSAALYIRKVSEQG